jgi:hypothetical protein
MNFYQAMKILDGIKDNLSYNLDTINRALELTGDLDIRQLEREASRTPSHVGIAKGLGEVCKQTSR